MLANRIIPCIDIKDNHIVKGVNFINLGDADGTKEGFDLSLITVITKAVNVPVVANGGAGGLQDFADVLQQANADAALAASLFHDQILTIGQVKAFLEMQYIPVRPVVIL